MMLQSLVYSAFSIMLFDWQQFHLDEAAPAVVDSRRRLRLCLGGFMVMLLIVFGRAVQLEVTQGAAFRVEATRPLERQIRLPGVRGRILARDGTVLAYDRKILAVAVHYRYLQQPPDADWLRLMARSRLTPAERKDLERVAAEQAQVQSRRAELAHRLARLCGLSAEEWSRRAGRIQARVERIAEGVNRRHWADALASEAPPDPQAGAPPPRSLLGRIGRLLAETFQASLEDSPPPRIAVAEELDYHVMAEDVPLAVVAEIEGHPEQYPGVKIVQRTRRAYCNGPLAAHVLGHLGPVEKDQLQRYADAGYQTDDLVGSTGLERQYESLLRGHDGLSVELADHSGRILSSCRKWEPGVGRDLVLTLDPPLQRAAETLLDSALKRRTICRPAAEPAGGAIVVLDVDTGAILAAASAPRFDPNLFVGGEAAALTALLSQADHPLFDRVSKMAIPPGSVFKTLVAVALLESSAVDPHQTFFCRGYLDQPRQRQGRVPACGWRQRCAIYRRQGIGHGEVTLCDALSQSCNVYFSYHAGRLGLGPLVDWARRFGFGRPTGVDLPGEAAGLLPHPRTNLQSLPGTRASAGDPEGGPRSAGELQLLAIGQGRLQVTPLQVVRMMAAVANGGRLVTPHVVSRLGLPELAVDASPRADSDDAPDVPPPQPISGLRPETLAAVREGLEHAVSDPRGTAYGTVRVDSIAIAGKTGTAETGGGRGDHAWFAGYAPANRPKLAFVVVLEHAGDGATTAGPVAKRLVLRMQQLGMLSQP
jgi:penicillin-binding protein 2